MSQEWLEYQGFIADHTVLQAITDLSIAAKLDLAGVRSIPVDTANARQVLESFLYSLSKLQSDSQATTVQGGRNLREIAGAFRSARSDSENFHSVLMRSGICAARALLDADDRPAKRALIESLGELRIVLTKHQSATLSAILEDF